MAADAKSNAHTESYTESDAGPDSAVGLSIVTLTLLLIMLELLLPPNSEFTMARYGMSALLTQIWKVSRRVGFPL